MTHEDIAEKNIVERYLMGKLPLDESARFEEHFVDCPSCLDRLELTDRFRAALKPPAPVMIRPATPGRPRYAWWAAAAVVLVAGGGLLFFAARYSALQREVELSRSASLEWKQRYEKERDEHAAPLAGPTFFLNLTRGREAENADPANTVVVSNGSQWVILAMQGELDPAMQSLRATLRDAKGTSVWQQDGLHAAGRETLSVILPARILRSGDYSLTIEGLNAAGRYDAGPRYRFRVSER